jgi:hypothetical protein
MTKILKYLKENMKLLLPVLFFFKNKGQKSKISKKPIKMERYYMDLRILGCNEDFTHTEFVTRF